MDLRRIEQTARKTALSVGKMLLEMQPRATALAQSYKDFVTDADLKAEEMIARELWQEFPAIPMYAEEGGGVASTKGPLWVIVPIDGTVNFFRQDDHYGVSIAFVMDGETQVGVVYFPGKKILLQATADTIPVAGVNKHGDMKTAQVWIDWNKGDSSKVLEAVKSLKEATMYPGIRSCCTAGMAAVALGKIEGYVILAPEPFDFAAMALIVEKHGGKVTQADGAPWNAFSPSIVASNGVIHQKLLEVINGRA